MAIDIHQLIAAINPDLFCELYLRHQGKPVNLIAQVKHTLRQHGFLAAAQLARPKQPQPMDLQLAKDLNPFSMFALKNPIEKHRLIYDNFSLNVAAIYFWVLDQLQDHCPHLKQIDKLIDNFASAPGSRHGADMAAQAANAQQQVLRLIDNARRLAGSVSSQINQIKELKRQSAAQNASGPATDRQNQLTEQELQARIQTAQDRLSADLNVLRAMARWLKPYLRRAHQLAQDQNPDVALVSIFNTTVLELTLLVQSEYDPQEDIDAGPLPKSFQRLPQRQYLPVLVLELRFRGLPERSQRGGYVFRGRLEMVFTSYALNQQEVQILKDQIQKDDLGDLFGAIADATNKTVSQLQQEIDQVLAPQDQSTTGHGSDDTDINPFLALFSVFELFRSDMPETTAGEVPAPDSAIEKVIRNQALVRARHNCRTFYEMFKQTHQMPVMYEPD